MIFISTRGGTPSLSFADVLLGALAPDGGLYMPERWPNLEVEALAGDYASVATAVIRPFLSGCFGDAETRELVAAALAGFEHPDIAPLVALEPDLYVLELFHGPTLAFKDIALQLLARLMARELERRNSSATILVATSGDTGSAAIAAFGGLARVELFVLHPKGRVSDVQRRQMTTATQLNVHNIALEGTFDHAQALVKALFADREFAGAMSLMAVNSINLVRIVAQSVYYFTATAKLGRPARFVVPTGNFGDIFAAEAAARMGLPVAGLVAATNSNDILVRALTNGTYAVREARATLSPSMDIQVASNFERALFEASNRDSGWLRAVMTSFAHERKLVIPPLVLDALQARYRAEAVSDEETVKTIRDVHLRHGRLIDPHTAVGLAAARRLDRQEGMPTVVLATAHAAKFPETVAMATGLVSPLPQRLGQSYVGTERLTVLPADAQRVRTFIEARTINHER
ncbi:MAG TPA: threonine synthase [Rhizomicrobium sp.]|jgi:threonine synthase|nr:threonine synthase [Rhizomicrobium sp.]